MKTKISTHKLQDRIWKVLILNGRLPKWADSGDIWDNAGEMLEDQDHQWWGYISREKLINTICNL